MFYSFLGKVKRLIYKFKYKKNIHGSGKISLRKEDYLKLSDSAQIQLHGNLNLGINSYGKNGRSCILRMDEGSLLEVQGSFSFMYGADIILFPGATLRLGSNSFINSDAKIRVHKNISIGQGCAISHDFTAMDSDAHVFNGNKKIGDIHIGNHVWIGTRVTVLSGVTIGDGAVVAAGALVTENVPPRTLAGGIPAKILKENVSWGDS